MIVVLSCFSLFFWQLKHFLYGNHISKYGSVTVRKYFKLLKNFFCVIFVRCWSFETVRKNTKMKIRIVCKIVGFTMCYTFHRDVITGKKAKKSRSQRNSYVCRHHRLCRLAKYASFGIVRFYIKLTMVSPSFLQIPSFLWKWKICLLHCSTWMWLHLAFKIRESNNFSLKLP